MIFADKLIQLRKKSGWSQEELAEQMHVTRQSVSKWEGAQSIPDFEKMIRLSDLFGVSTDYLLKDELEEIELNLPVEESPGVRRVSMEEANAFLAAKAFTAKRIAYATLLCILSPICLILLGGMSEYTHYGLTETAAGGIGMVVLLVLVAVAVAIYISCGSQTAAYAYLEKEIFETEYGVSGMVKARQAQYKSTYTRNNIVGACMCILSLIPLFAGAIYDEDNDLLLLSMLAIMLVCIGVGVLFFIRGGIVWASFEKLLQEGEYARERKGKSPVLSAISSAYWLGATAIFLWLSFKYDSWQYSWIVWAIAGVLYPAVVAIVRAFEKPKAQ